MFFDNYFSHNKSSLLSSCMVIDIFSINLQTQKLTFFDFTAKQLLSQQRRNKQILKNVLENLTNATCIAS